jgi:glycosyltransferase involved in cell wall biosynthesis
MPFPSDDPYWLQVRSFLEEYAQPLDAILAPNDFLEFFPGTYHYNVSNLFSASDFAFVVLHKGLAREIDPALALEVLQDFQPVFANSVFVVYAKSPLSGVPSPEAVDIEALIKQFEVNQQFYDLTPARQTCAAVVTTYNRPECLERSLPQIVALNIPVVVVDDGSSFEQAAANQKIADQYQVPLLYIPNHRQSPSAINMGVSYWLADPTIAWISYFQDNVQVKPETLAVLTQIQDAKERPLLTGWDAQEHTVIRTDSIAGHKILYRRSTSGVHLHAHRDYWAGVLPIPTPNRAEHIDQAAAATDEDWWITAWAPKSIAKQGGYIICAPGLVNQFDVTKTEKDSSLLVVGTPQKQTVSIEKPEELSLEGVRVLVDGYNLQLTKGTGIKTYGLSLIQALNQLGANVDVLLSRNGYRANEVLDEVYFFDNQTKNQNLFTVAKGLIKTASGPLYRARRRKTFSNFVIKRGQYGEDFLKYVASFNLPQCYDVANILYKKLNLTTNISVPEKIDLWHATYPLPMQIRGAKKITTIHDLIPLRLPYATLDDKENFYYKVRDALKESAVTITVSEHSKQDLLTYFDVDPDKIVVTYQPIALEPLEATEEEVSFILKRYGLEYQNYLLFVGAIEPKKNVGRLLDAYATLDTDMPLVIVGKKGWLWEDELGKTAYLFDSKESQKRVKLLEYISSDHLRYLYSGAYCLVFPSLYEGFGLPPVEAMHFGCPVVTSNVASLPEVCGNAALYVDPYDVRDIKQKLEELLSDPKLRDRLSKAGRQNAKSFNMENYVGRLYKAYRKALE